jgi:hypothetical protein
MRRGSPGFVMYRATNAAIFQYIGSDQKLGTIAVSSDGVTWNSTRLVERGVQSLACDPLGNVIALARCGILRSTDAGLTWSDEQSWMVWLQRAESSE